MYGTIINDRMRTSVILRMISSGLEACDRKICIIFHTTDVRIKELFYYLFNVLFACGNFTATTAVLWRLLFFNQRVPF